MTEPSPRASSVGRTVTVALALVAGQLALCVVIGWLTFGNPFRPASTTSPVVAAPPAGPADAVREPLGSRAPAPTRPVKIRRSAGAGPTGADPIGSGPSAVRTAAPAPPRSRTATSAAAPMSREPARTPTPDTALVPSVRSPAIQEPVEPGRRCAPVNAEGRTAGGAPVRCLRARDGVPRWHLTG